MAELVRVAVDAMGGDNAPFVTVKGAVDAVKESQNLKVFLVGKKDIVEKELSAYEYDKDKIEVVDATEVIEMAEPPVMAIRKKKDSSIVKAMYMVNHGEADAYVSAGSTGATLVGGQVIVGRLKGVDRAPLAPLIPTEKGNSLLIDCGANVDARSNHLVQFAKMGTVYMENVMGIKNPTVAIVNIGAEEEKGNALVKETFPLLKNCPDINFIGSIEARDIPAGFADIIVCEAFTGNVILKMYEGVAKSMMHVIKKSLMSNLKTKIGALLIKDDLKKSLSDYSMDKYGGAPMLGLKGLVVKTHGSANDIEVKNSILQCVTFTEQKISEKISAKLSDEG
ncbi:MULTISPECIES: phosphate acyltransferase PlsX [unclassified Butyrivibrio]|jgi:glycerol-3-phosphate acyltransferase PlsX|uniref:phosphate acyltransferase PlsX n=1 Tax=unclassified Butyrivibrio TaxID=2639466 RepID=UPI0003B5C3DA|nr:MULTISPECIES: phosphate acyltransferase PlsX [unclassified Butyrivibrio]MBE5836749.1 phosphate acyltransferase PlsX [Butyrivibrio sp.]MBQ9304736.1 phosphate acyltransferase PlsX [Butyrivibrio sp.]